LQADTAAAVETAVHAAWQAGRGATAERWAGSPLQREALALVVALEGLARGRSADKV
jgi:hypothetical protein